MKSLDRIEGLMRAGTADAFQSAQQELRAMTKIMRHGAARTEREASRREQLLELLDLIERRVSGIAAKRASAAEGFTPFKAATTRRAAGVSKTLVAPVQAHAGVETRENDSSEERPTNIGLTQRLADDSAYVPFEMEAHGEPLSAPREEARRHIHAPAKAMPKTSHSVPERMAASATLPVLAELTEEERLALFT
ncbi:MAG TPA: hypothetical protein VFX37_14935 [Pseudolabrys sp.]|nr:hypothetical protein [Pseudolabrys sp.]